MLYFNMINISTNKQLGIMLPNTNRALAEVVKNATPKQLETLAEGKDIKSILNSLLQESTQHTKSDKVLLDLLKNNPTLKSLGKVSETIKALLHTLQSDKNPLPIEKTLKNFLIDMKQMSEPLLKEKIENSGVFLESRLKQVHNPKIILKTELNALLKALEQSTIPAAKSLRSDVKNLLSNTLLQNASAAELTQKSPPTDTKALDNLVKQVEHLLGKLQTQFKGADPIYSKHFASLLHKSEQLLRPETLQQQQPTHNALKPLQENLTQLSKLLNSSNILPAQAMTSQLDAIVKTLNTVMKTPQPLASLHDLKLPQHIGSLLEKAAILSNKADPIYSKEVASLVEKIGHLNAPNKLEAHHHIKEIASNDLKAVLLQASDEISKSAHPNQSDLLRQIDKLTLQIDYYQLMSHLCNASSLYLPLSWEQLEEGNITLNHSDDEKFYCDIDLKLKEYGNVKLRLILYDENQLNLHLFSENSTFKQLLKEHIPLLRSALIEAEITPREIRIVDLSRTAAASTPYETQTDTLKMGFEVKV